MVEKNKKIVEKIEDIHKAVTEPGGTYLADELQKQGIKAIRGGIGHANWKAFMCNFASNPAQLRRLNGEDPKFNDTIYGLDSLAYMAANVTCASSTTANTGRFMNYEMLNGLDYELSDVIESIPECKENEDILGQILR